ncbi:MAG TPA: DUF4062 domain-containing protein [Microbacterium sp.]|nr:DUF4062 domain-containing protein [Microbacterium sp.]
MGDAVGARTSPIRTPDQRLRVFVSSTLRELEAERRAARSAIEGMRMAPVMFELGARPHPPRDLYRAYLEQSDVFVGIYAERYGWIAPGEEVSGLEDEYRLAPRAMPKLIYLKRAEGRDDRLAELIARIQSDDTASYKAFTSEQELADLVEADLATLLAERFDASRTPVATVIVEPLAARIPSPYTRLIGRDAELAAVLELLGDRDRRLVTLLGPGGIGKSRLAIAVAASTAAAELFPDGTVFVALENVLEPDLVLPTIGYALGVRDAGDLPLEQRLAIALEGRRILLVLDNFEQLIDAAPVLVRLYTVAPDASFLVTSRVLLRIRGEQIFDVPTLATHDPASPDSVTRARTSPAVELFVDRARAVRADFELTDANAAAVVAICRALQGLPLAIELAAARMRVLSPSGILERLDTQLPLLVDSSRDLPERQRTLRATIEWSTGLLREDERVLLHELGVFSAGFTLDSLEAYGAHRGWEFDAFTALETLVDSSLVDQSDIDGESVFSLLATVREFALERLRAGGQEDAARQAHADVYVELSRREGRGLGSDRQIGAVARLNLERGNLRAAVRHLASIGAVETASDTAWTLYLYWWVGGYLTEVAVWMEGLLASGRELSPRTRAIATFYVAWRDMWLKPSHEITRALRAAAEDFAAVGEDIGATMAAATAGLAEISTPDPDIASAATWLRDGADRFRALGVGWGETLALVALGRMSVLGGDFDEATAHFERGLAAATSSGDTFAASVATHHVARMRLFRGRVDESERLFRTSIEESIALSHEEGIAYGLEGLSAIAALRGDAERAGVLAGAASAIRKRSAVFDSPAFVFHKGYLDALGAQGESARIAAAEVRGAEYGAHEAAQYALVHIAPERP